MVWGELQPTRKHVAAVGLGNPHGLHPSAVLAFALAHWASPDAVHSYGGVTLSIDMLRHGPAAGGHLKATNSY